MTNPRKLTVLSSALLLASLTACGGGGGGGGSDDDTPRNPEKPLTTLPQFLQGNEALCDFIESGKTVSLQNYTGELGNVTGLTCNGVTLSDLDEISLLTALQQLSLDSAGLTNVTELLNNLTLQQLDLSGNPIADLSIITSLLNLTELDLENTGLSDISLLNALTALQQLDVSGNAITDVAPLGNLLNLTDLDLSANNITELDALGALTSLNNLDVSGNPSLSCAEINDLALASAADITVPSNCTSAAFLSASSDATQTLDNSSLAEPIERLVIRDVNSLDDLQMFQSGDDLRLTANTSGGIKTIIFTHWFVDATYQVDEFEVEGVGVYGFAALRAQIGLGLTLTEGRDTYLGTDGRDVVYGLGEADIIAGGGQADVIVGGPGNDIVSGSRLNIAADGTVSRNNTSDGYQDTFIYNLGDDHDTIYEYETGAEKCSLLQFGTGISSEDISLYQDGKDLIIELNDTDKLTVDSWFEGSQYYYRLGYVQFQTGDPIEASQWVASKGFQSTNGEVAGTSLAESLVGSDNDDRIYGLGGADIIEGGEGNDHLSGNRLNIAADGTVSVFGSSDVAMDTFIFNLGDDHDTLYEYETSAEYRALLQFGAGISPDDIIVIRDSDDLILEINEEDKVT
ncbi:MAG: leucine-rich repeat domain-containing protein, partial [Pseudomonadota bacterium]|nr:leucine-rich repeat domain-containing protein [Pseudomonadota bacterium]